MRIQGQTNIRPLPRLINIERMHFVFHEPSSQFVKFGRGATQFLSLVCALNLRSERVDDLTRPPLLAVAQKHLQKLGRLLCVNLSTRTISLVFAYKESPAMVRAWACSVPPARGDTLCTRKTQHTRQNRHTKNFFWVDITVLFSPFTSLLKPLQQQDPSTNTHYELSSQFGTLDHDVSGPDHHLVRSVSTCFECSPFAMSYTRNKHVVTPLHWGSMQASCRQVFDHWPVIIFRPWLLLKVLWVTFTCHLFRRTWKQSYFRRRGSPRFESFFRDVWGCFSFWRSVACCIRFPVDQMQSRQPRKFSAFDQAIKSHGQAQTWHSMIGLDTASARKENTLVQARVGGNVTNFSFWRNNFCSRRRKKGWKVWPHPGSAAMCPIPFRQLLSVPACNDWSSGDHSVPCWSCLVLTSATSESRDHVHKHDEYNHDDRKQKCSSNSCQTPDATVPAKQTFWENIFPLSIFDNCFIQWTNTVQKGCLTLLNFHGFNLIHVLGR